MIPSSRATSRKAASACVVGDRHVARAAGVAQPGVLGPDAGVVEAGRDRVRLEDLALVVLHDRRVRAPCSTPARPADGQRRAVAAGLDALARRLDADELDARRRRGTAVKMPIAFEPPPTQATHAVGQAPVALEHLRARLVADHALEVAHDRRVRRRADGRADHVVGGRRRW